MVHLRVRSAAVPIALSVSLQVELLRPIGPRGDAELLLRMRSGAAVTIECSWDR